MIRTLTLTMVFAATICSHSSNLLGGIIQNPSFESPRLANSFDVAFYFQGDTIGSGWIVDQQSNSAAVLSKTGNGGGGIGGPTTTDGDQYLLIGAAPLFGTIRQDVALEALTSYRLTFQLADQSQNASGASLNVDVLRSGVSILGGSKPFNVAAGSDFKNMELLFNTNQAGTYRLNLLGTAGGPSIDAFNLVVAVPEPSAVALALIALGAFVVHRRRDLFRRKPAQQQVSPPVDLFHRRQRFAA